MMDTTRIKKDFPILKTTKGLVYLDSAASSLRPSVVIDAMDGYYREYSSNIHRGLYPIAERASQEYEETRAVTADFIHASSADEIIFTRNATESLNLLAYCFESEVKKGDEIVTTIVEHHANFVTWQQLCVRSGATFTVIDANDDGMIDFNDALSYTITPKTKICALSYISNVLGVIHPMKEIIKQIRKINPNTIVIIDAAQAAPHHVLDVQDLDCDFLVFSSHKMCGPTGVGVLWGRKALLEKMPPFMYGGDMIEEVFVDRSTFNKVPYKFEAGTPDIAGVIGLKVAIRYLQGIGLANIQAHESHLFSYFVKKVHEVCEDGVTLIGPTSGADKIGVAAFTVRGCHPHDVAGMLGEENICIRAGHHCAMPLHTRLRLPASCRVSMYLYNDTQDIDTCVRALKHVITMLT